MLTHVGVFSVDFSRIDTGKTVCFLVSGGLPGGIFCYSCYSFVCTLMNSARSLEYRMVWLLYSPQ